ncbi:hypothetical protein F4678DRAFT_445509 [Xylaria arbuscula]|nr:hypothetical protein F4678DRAFT_445509 [Xylaria arbuscula]
MLVHRMACLCFCAYYIVGAAYNTHSMIFSLNRVTTPVTPPQATTYCKRSPSTYFIRLERLFIYSSLPAEMVRRRCSTRQICEKERGKNGPPESHSSKQTAVQHRSVYFPNEGGYVPKFRK